MANGNGIPLADLRSQAAALGGHLTGLRRRIHAHPELGLDNPRTQAVIVEELQRLGITQIEQGKGCTSVTAEITGAAAGAADRPAHRVALRADMDALPISERTGEPWASEAEGVMHACGHDGHVAMLLGAAELLQGLRGSFAGSVRLLFQPGEEGPGGARVMIGEGALRGVNAAFAIHLAPQAPSHWVVWRAGPVLAAEDSFEVVFLGAGGHASMPALAKDPIPAIGPFVDGLSHAVAREGDPADTAVISVTQVRAGSAPGVIPATARCGGTIRTLSEARREACREQVRRIARGVAAARGIEADIEIIPGYPATVNHERPAGLAAEVAEALGLTPFHLPTPIMAAEDFSYMLQEVPGCIVFLGCQVAGGGPLHSDTMQLDEEVLPTGAALHAAMALRLLREEPANEAGE